MKHAVILLFAFLLNACSQQVFESAPFQEAQVTDVTRAGEILAALPLPNRQIPVVVYDFQDQTGQFKFNDNFSDYSSAVTKGGLAVLVKALLDTGNGGWFLVSERGGINNLLKERQIIRTMRQEYTRPDGTKLPDLPPLLYGGLLLEGGIIFYDYNILTGGAAAGYFGISGSAQYRRDIITVYLRGIDINNGQVVIAVNSTKTVYSYAVNAGFVRFLTFDKLLEAETGFTANEPTQLAVRQAIETSVYSLIMEGAMRGMWGFNDRLAGEKAINEYIARRDTAGKVNVFDKLPRPRMPSSATAPMPEQRKPANVINDTEHSGEDFMKWLKKQVSNKP